MSDARQEEIDNLERLRRRAKLLMQANPELTRDGAFARACQELPKTTNRYLYAVSLLTQRGVRSLPIRE